MMSNKRNVYIIVAAVIIIIGLGGNWYLTEQRKAERAEELLAEKYEQWVVWSRTIYIGTIASDYHPGIAIGRGNRNYLEGYLRGGKLLWVDANDINIFNPSLAESWEFKVNSDGEAYVEYKIVQGLKFPDGTDVDAEAVKYTWERERYELATREKHGETYHVYSMSTGWKRLEVPDKYTLLQFLPEDNQNFLPHPFSFIHALAHSHIVSPESSETYAKETNAISDFANQVGYGPFLLESFVVDQQSVLVPWDDYVTLGPTSGTTGPTKVTELDKVVIIEYADATSLRMALERGEVDIVDDTIADVDYQDLLANPDIVTDRAPAIGYCMLFHMNHRPEFAPFNDLDFRKAVSYAIFPEELVEKCLFGLGSVADSAVRTFQPYYLPVWEEIRSLPDDERIDIAKDLLAKAGYPDGYSTEIWIPDNIDYRNWATIVQAQLLKIGIRTTIKSFESGVYYDEVRAGHAPMFFRGWTLDYNDPDSELWYLLHSSSDKQAQRMGYNNSYIDSLLERGKELYDPTGDPAERQEIYEEIQQIMFDDTISIPLMYQDMYQAWNSWVEDYVMWKTTHTTCMGVWNARKVIPDNWETTDPPR